MSQFEQPKILLLMSGSIACAKATSLISDWNKAGYRVRVACTRGVSAFVGPATLQGLGAEMVFDDVFATGQAMEHIELAHWADVVVAAPVTSNLLNKLSAGIADDAVTTLWQAAWGRGKPMLLAPAMNTHMWRYPATQASVERLQQWGVLIMPVAVGELACGDHGEGRMPEPAMIFARVEGLLHARRQDSGKRILVTAGGTREPIDSVRYIGNLSSGRTAARLADDLAVSGHAVTWLGAHDAVEPSQVNSMVRFGSFTELRTQLQNLLGADEYDAVIHAAAVSDFSVACVDSAVSGCGQAADSKLSSAADLVLKLKRNPKLLDQLKSWSRNPNLRVIGFKLTHTRDLEQRIAAVKRQFERSGVDAVVHNDLSDITPSAHPFFLHVPRRTPVDCRDSGVLATRIEELLEAVA